MEKNVFSVGKKDLTITYFSGTGAGGQHRNRHMNCVRIKHNATGIIVTGQSHRDRASNQKEALKNLARNKRFLAFCNMKLVEQEREETIPERVDKMMSENNLLIEVKKDGKWTVEGD